jgi:hypothetical protein
MNIKKVWEGGKAYLFTETEQVVWTASLLSAISEHESPNCKQKKITNKNKNTTQTNTKKNLTSI